jgi:hypothetical protein
MRDIDSDPTSWALDPIVACYRRMKQAAPHSIERCPTFAIPVLWKILQYLETQQEPRHRGSASQNPPRLFSLLPTKKSFIPQHFSIGSYGLYELLRLAGQIDPGQVPQKSWNADLAQRSYWRRYFKFHSVRPPAGYTPTWTLESDGYAVAVKFEKLSSCPPPNRTATALSCMVRGY